MSATTTAPEQAPGARRTTTRLASVDLLRGLIILVMIFVNDVAGVVGTPGWMKHIEPPDADGMTFVDVVFPAFLFIVGLAIPLALERRLASGSRTHVAGHILVRGVSLLVLGVFMVNTGSASAAGLLPRDVWTLAMYAGAILLWLELPGRPGRLRRFAGAAALLLVAILYRGPGAPGLIELRPQWWGILGLIGWAYLVAAGVYLGLRRRTGWLAAAVVALYALYAGDALGWLPAIPALAVGSMLGSHAALTLSGALAGAAMLLPDSPFRAPAERLRFAAGYGVLMALAAVALHTLRDVHPMFIINKIAATPAWCLWSAAITIWLWASIYWAHDVRGWGQRVLVPLALAGQNALLAYILAPIAYALLSRSALLLDGVNPYARLGASFWPGFARSVCFALFICWLAALLRRRQFVLKL